jgi:hypothetical protein
MALNSSLIDFVAPIPKDSMKPAQGLILSAIFLFIAAAAMGFVGYMNDKTAFYGVAAAFVGAGVIFLAAAKSKRPK